MFKIRRLGKPSKGEHEENLQIPHRELFNELVLLSGEHSKEHVGVLKRKVFKAFSSQQVYRRNVEKLGRDKDQLGQLENNSTSASLFTRG